MKKNNSNKEKVLLAMSGGIDSSFCVYLLQKQGYEVIGVYLNNLKNDDIKNNWQNIKKIADFYKIKIYKVKAAQRFTKNVMRPFIKAYAHGLTPNPCILCNRVFKFKELFDLADKLKIQKVTTGHYAKLKSDKNFIYLSPAKDESKDQVYFLYQLPQRYLKRLLFPLGHFMKSEIKDLAKDVLPPNLLPKSESQEICFVPQDDLSEFLKKTLKKRSGGEIIDAKNGVVLGKYSGNQFFTIGQRKGLGLGGGPWYVSRFDVIKNKVFVLNENNKQTLKQKYLILKNIYWTGAVPKATLRVKYKLRSTQKWTNGILQKNKNQWILHLAKKQLAPSPGQSAVFLANTKVLGGAVIV